MFRDGINAAIPDHHCQVWGHQPLARVDNIDVGDDQDIARFLAPRHPSQEGQQSNKSKEFHRLLAREGSQANVG